MRRPLFIAALVLVLACVPLSAQRGGGHASGGGHGFGGGHGSFGGGHIGGGHAFGGMRSGAGLGARSLGRGRSFNRSFSRGFNRSRNGLRNRNRLGIYGYNCSLYGCGWGYGGYAYPYLGGGIDPYWWWDSSSNQDQQDSQANDVQQSVGDQDLYAKSTPAPAPRPDKQATEVVPATVLVFHDQHKLEVQNYAIVGQTLWNFAPGHTEKIPLSDLDLPATTKANDERGVDFRLPGRA